MTPEEARDMILRVVSVFQPRTPVATRELFAGRWTEITSLADAVGQKGLHVIIYGERGIGKTSLANIVAPIVHVLLDGKKIDRPVIRTNAGSADDFTSIWQKIFGEISWTEDRPAFGLSNTPGSEAITVTQAFNLRDQITPDDVRKVVSHMPGAVFIVDEFDSAAENAASEFTDLIKTLADRAVDCTIILVGVSDTVDELVADHASIHRSLIQIQLPRMKTTELEEILKNGEKQLGISFSDEARILIAKMSQGLPHYTHLLGLHSVRGAANARRSKSINSSDVFAGLKEAVKQAQQAVTGKYLTATHSAHKDALYRHVLLACALTAARNDDPLGYFNPSAVIEPLSFVLQKSVQIATFSNHLNEFSQEKRGSVLERVGQERSYRFRFRDSLLVPYIFMEAVNNGLISEDGLSKTLEEDSLI